MNSMKVDNRLFSGLFLGLVLFLPACSTLKITHSHPVALSIQQRMVAGPIANYSDTPLANKQVESMLMGILYAKGFVNTQVFPKKQACDKLLYCPADMPSRDAMCAWARAHGVRYVLTGSVNEWRYKVGLDGEPVTGVSLVLLDSQSGRVSWSGVGSAIGTSRQGLDVVGQQMLQKLLAQVIPIAHADRSQGK